MGLLNLPDDFDTIPVRKQINELLREAQRESKPNKCILCGTKKSSFCNSHSVPQMVLRNIANNGKLLQANALIGLEVLDISKGINNSGTFHFICNDCDGRYFQDYENPTALLTQPSDRMLAEIALKDTLIQLAKRNQELKMFEIAQNRSQRYSNFEDLEMIKNLDINEYTADIAFYKDIVDNDKQGGFQILYWSVLPYKTPIAVQSMFVLMEDLEGHTVNNVFDPSQQTRMQNMHICVFPLEKETIVLCFYHKRDKNYRSLRHQLNCVSDDTKLKYFNWLIFKYTENYFFSEKIKHDLESNEKLIELSHDNSGAPNMGMIDDLKILQDYKAPTMDEIPNFLDARYAI